MLKACVFVSDMEDKPFSQGPDNAGVSAAESGPDRADTVPTGIIHRSVFPRVGKFIATRRVPLSHTWENTTRRAASPGGLCGLSLGMFQKRKYRLAFQ